MSEFGEDLKKERESRKITLACIAEATKVSSRHLAALEQSRFDDLPGGVFNKGIVRSYAQVVGLNPEKWVVRYIAAYQSSGQMKDDDVSWTAFAENVGKSRPKADRPAMRLKWAGVTALVVLLAALGWLAWNFLSIKLAA
ncbi:MAG: helix-turn-helix domain-containing protein [Acidobacteriaceae bacterium]